MRGLWGALVVGAIALVGCGGGGGTDSNFGDDGGTSVGFDATSPSLNGGDGARGPSCTPRDCKAAGANCGPVADGCGGQIDCGSCTAPATCGGGGTISVCGGNAGCVPKTCKDLNVNCGKQPDGCGGEIDCGSCNAPQTCGGGGVPSQCGGTAGCIPLTACSAGWNCGTIGDGCGGKVDCSKGVPCPLGTTCGGGGTSYECGAVGILPDGGIIDGGLNQCTPATKAQACGSKNCGVEADGCGGTVDCGSCTAPQTCGGGTSANPGKPSVCGGNAGCIPIAKCPAGMNCGIVADGCGGTVDCSGGKTCPGGTTCGGGGTANQCGAKNVLPDGGIIDGGLNQCTPATKAQACGSKNCGVEADGCGGTVDCGSCTAPQTCGGGNPGTPSVCGGNAGCVPVTACPVGMNCGVIANGCGGTVDCSGGKTCPGGTTCGGGGTPNQCGAKNVLPDGGFIDGGLNQCTPIPQATACAGIGCGIAGDGCGNTYVCGTCTNPLDSCGGGGVPFQCGHPACTPATSCPGSVQCGIYANGCGGTLTCGSCTSPATCGGGGTSYQCGSPPCTPATTCPSGVNCGPWPDGCGGTIASCGTCNKPAICGGSGVASQCGDGTDGGFVCQGLQCNQVQCDGGATTSISGVVLDPAGLNPVYNAVVFVPSSSSPLPAFAKGISCNTCADQETSLISVTTGPDGTFTLNDVPVVPGGTPIVIQIGRWRREIVAPITACTNNPLTAAQTHLPTTHLQTGDQATDLRDDIPLMAISTGNADPFQCLIVKMGVATSEFVNPQTDTTGGRIHYYTENGIDLDPSVGGPAPAGSNLWSSSATLDNYDLVLLPCEGGPNDHGDPARTNLGYYADHGGRVFVTHFSYEWAAPGNTGAPWGSIASWDENQPYLADPNPDWCELTNTAVRTPVTITGNINQTFKKGADFATWLQLVGATTTKGQLTEHEARHDLDSVPAGGVATPWITTTNVDTNTLIPYSNGACQKKGTQSKANSASSLQHMTFNTPVGATPNDAGVTSYCGRVVYSDFHVSASALTGQSTFPAACQTGALSAQEKALEFMLFDLSSCIQSDNLPPPPNPKCTPLTACPSGIVCGSWPDGCGGSLSCGTCSTGQCVNGTCSTACKKLSCTDQGLHCGAAGDGCGGTIPNGCGTCPAGQTCSGGNCITSTCVGKTCADFGLHCGPANDGCGNPLNCGTCTVPGQTCGGGGTPGVCGQSDANLCAPLSCSVQNVHCGPAGDGCGNLIDCGPCPAGSTCGGGGVPGVCGAPNCTPLGCGTLQCGPTGDGCGSVITCGTCTVPGQTCGGGGTPGVCGQGDANACAPLSCSSQNLHCGPAGDGCGNLLDCGSCPAGQSCGGGGVPGQCGAPNCKPLTCGDQHLSCGQTGDGCGHIIDCGPCTAPQTCGGGGTPGVCGELDAIACIPLTCASQHVACGPAGDGCGNLLDCGQCTAPQTCGGGGIPGVCGAPSCTPQGCGSANCGQVADGCGGLTPVCGTCSGNQTCGGGGTASQCGAPNCTPRTCQQAGANCGPIGDGCGGIVQCGDCTPPQTCGGAGTPSVCGGGLH